MTGPVRGRGPAGVVVPALAVAAAVVAVVVLRNTTDAAPDGGTAGHPYRDADLPVAARVEDLVGRMTLAEKVGQMAQAERADVEADPALLTEHHIGSVLSGGGSVPSPNTPTAWADLVDRYQEAALETRLGIPLLYGVDAVHGHANLHGATVFPHNIGLGATRNPRLVEEIAHITAEETRASGPQWTFAPCLCVARDDRWGRTYESFGETPELVTSMATAIDGLQGGPGELDEPDRVLATAKHFAGDGLTSYDDSLAGSDTYPIDQGVAQVDRETFEELAVSPYRPAVERHDVGSVMPSFSSVDWTEDGLGEVGEPNGPVKLHAHRELLTDVLEGELGFDGIVLSDWRAVHQLPGSYRDQVKASVLAGVDMFMEPQESRDHPPLWGDGAFIETLTELVESGEVPVSRIDDAVSRILTKKFELGLFEEPFTDRTHLGGIGSAEHRAVARRAVAESQVLLKNERGAVPIAQGRPVYVAGSTADNIGNQVGGWTLTWQGGSTHELPGNTVLDGIRAEAGKVTYSADASAPVRPGSVGVVVVGETPYAEGFGDVGGPRWAFDPADGGVERPEQTMHLSAADRSAVEKVCGAATTCVVVVVSGRPLVIEPSLLRQVDALQAAWLPGSQGEGVSDVLFGRRPYTGRLPVSWPRSVAQEPINVGDADYDPLFRYGRGLRTR